MSTVRDLWAAKANMQREARRKQVAGMALIGVSTVEIAKRVGVHRSTVLSDMRAIRQDWLNVGLPDIHVLRMEEVRKLDALEREAWALGKYDIVLKIVAQRCKILGIDAPKKYEMLLKKKPEDYSDDELAAIAGLTPKDHSATGSDGTTETEG